MSLKLCTATVAVLFAVALASADVVAFEDEASFLGALSAHLHENFDAYTSGQLISSLPAVNVSGVSGINHQGSAVSQYVTAQVDLPFPMLGGLDTSSLPNLFSNDLSPQGGYGTGKITFDFASGMNAIGFYVADGSPLNTFRIDLYDGGVMVGTADSAGPKMLPDSFFGVTSTVLFDSATIGSNQNTDSWGIDDLYTQVPEPGTAALAGLLALFALRRR